MILAHIRCLPDCSEPSAQHRRLSAQRSTAFDNKASYGFSFRRIQSFMAQMGVDLNAVARYQVAHPTRWTIHTYDEPHELEEKKVFVPGISYVVLHPVRVCGKVTDYEYYSLNIPRD